MSNTLETGKYTVTTPTYTNLVQYYTTAGPTAFNIVTKTENGISKKVLEHKYNTYYTSASAVSNETYFVYCLYDTYEYYT